MSQAIFHYFSGTGNTFHVVEYLAEKLRQAGYETEEIRIETVSAPQSKSADLHLFLFPVYACSVPHIMQQYLQRVSPGAGAKAVVLSTNGRISTRFRDGYEGQALALARQMLQRRGYQVFLTDTLDYPHNITNVLNPSKPESQAEIIRQADVHLEQVAGKILDGEASLRGCHWFNYAWSAVFGFFYNLIGRRIFGKCFVADHTCVHCGKCAKICPAQAIRMVRGTPRWNWNCEGCERCMNICPKRSIQTSLIRVATLIGLAVSNPLAGAVVSFIPGAITTAIFPDWIIGIVFDAAQYFFTFYLLEKAIWGFELLPGVRRIFQLSYTKYYRRYLAPGFRL